MAGGSYDNYAEQIRAEFVDEAEDNLNTVEIILENLRSGNEDPAEALNKIRRPIHSLKGTSSVADFPLVTVVMHRLEDYMSNIKQIEKPQIEDIQIYIDKARELSSLDVDQTDVSSADLVRQLPNKHIEGVEAPAELDQQIIEAFLVVHERTAGLLFERELRAAGLRVTTMRRSFEALEMAVRTQPDIIILSGVIDALTGVDVACALHAMPKTKHIPVCILTSFEREHHELAGLPEDVRLIQKSKLKENLLDTLKTYKLLG